MKRLLIVPVVAAGVCVAAYLSGLAWPILTTALSVFGRRPVTPYTEPEIVA